MARVFNGGDDSGEGGLGFGIGLLLTLLPLPGGFYAVFLFEKYSTLLQWMRGEHVTDPATAALPEEYFFVVLSMFVTGILAVWRWDSIFPDRRDYANLVPLPLQLHVLFSANLFTIFLLALLLAIDVNAASALLFPLAVGASIDSFGFFVHFVWVHASVVVIASVFTFFSVFLCIGVLMLVLPYKVFRSISVYFRSVIVGCLFGMLATSYVVPAAFADPQNSFIRYVPSVWFTALAQVIRGSANPMLVTMGRTALLGVVIVLLAAVLIYAISYRKCFIRIPETGENAARTPSKRASWIFRVLDGTILGSPFQKAGYRFIVKTLFRSEQHSLVLGGFVCLGIVIASQFLFSSSGAHLARRLVPSPDVLAIPLILSYCTMLGLRFSFDLPTELRANWIFRLWLDKSKDAESLALKIILSFIFPWVIAIAVPAYGFMFGIWAGVLQGFVVMGWSFVFSKLLLLRFQKLPFTCTYPPFRQSAVVVSFYYILGFVLFVIVTSHLEFWALHSPTAVVCLIASAAVANYVVSRVREDVPDVDKELIFEESPVLGFELLDLSRGS